VDNKAYLDQYGADKASIVRNITRAFAHQIFVDGFYTADPHPGEGRKDMRRGKRKGEEWRLRRIKSSPNVTANSPLLTSICD
jgi:ABC1 atypical kinase-like domain